MATFEKLIQKTILLLSQVPGSGTQLYAEDRIGAIIQSTFDLVFAEAWWPQYMQWYTRALDGSTGSITQTIDINDYSDIRIVFEATSDVRLSVLSTTTNPTILTGTTPRYMEGSNVTGKPVKIWPTTATGSIVIHGRVRPTDFAAADNVLFDAMCLVHGACWQYMEDDASNPAATAKFQTLFEARLKQLKRDLSSQPIDLDPNTVHTTEKWTEY